MTHTLHATIDHSCSCGRHVAGRYGPHGLPQFAERSVSFLRTLIDHRRRHWALRQHNDHLLKGSDIAQQESFRECRELFSRVYAKRHLK